MQLNINSQKDQSFKNLESKLNDFIQTIDGSHYQKNVQEFIVLQQKQLVIPIEKTELRNKKQFKSRANQYLQIVSFQDKDKIDQSKSTIRIAENSVTSSNHESMHFKKSFNELNQARKNEIPWINNPQKRISDYTPQYILNNSKILINSNSEDAILQSFIKQKQQNVNQIEDYKNVQQQVQNEISYEDTFQENKQNLAVLNKVSSKNISGDLLKQQVSLADKEFRIQTHQQQNIKEQIAQNKKIRYLQIDQDQLISQLHQIDNKLDEDITNEIMIAERRTRGRKIANIQKSIMPIYAQTSDDDRNSQSPSNINSPILKTNLQKKIQLVKKFINTQLNSNQVFEKKSIQLASYFKKKNKKINDLNFDLRLIDRRYQSIDVDNQETLKQKLLMQQLDQIIQKQTPRFDNKIELNVKIKSPNQQKIKNDKERQNSPYKRQTIQQLVQYEQDNTDNLNLKSSNDSQNMFQIKNTLSGSLVVPKIESHSAVDEFKNAIIFNSRSKIQENKIQNLEQMIDSKIQIEPQSGERQVQQNNVIEELINDKNIQCSYNNSLSKTVLDKSHLSSNAKLINQIKIVKKNLSEGLDDDYQQRYSTESFSPYEKNLQQPALIHSPLEITETYNELQFIQKEQKQASPKQKNIIKPNFKMSPENILIQNDKQNNEYILYSNMKKQNSPRFQNRIINKIDLIFNNYKQQLNQQIDKSKDPSPKSVGGKQNLALITNTDNYPESKTNSILRNSSQELLEALAINREEKQQKQLMKNVDQIISNSIDQLNLKNQKNSKLQNIKSSYKQYQFKVKKEGENEEAITENEKDFKSRQFVKQKRANKSRKNMKHAQITQEPTIDNNIIIQQTNNPQIIQSNIIIGVNPQKIEKKQNNLKSGQSSPIDEKDPEEVKVVHSINYQMSKKFTAFATLNNDSKKEKKIVKIQEFKLLDDWKNGKLSNQLNQSPISQLSSDICNVYQDQFDRGNRGIIDMIQEEALQFSSLEQSISLFNIQHSSTSMKPTEITFEDQKLFLQKLMEQNSKEMISNQSSKNLKANQNQINYVNLNDQFQVQSKQFNKVVQINQSNSPKSNKQFLLLSPSKESELIQEEIRTNQQILSSQTSNNEYMIVQKKILKQRASNSQNQEKIKFKLPNQKTEINSDLNNIFDIQKDIHKQIITRNLINKSSNSSSEKQSDKNGNINDLRLKPQIIEEKQIQEMQNSSITNFKKSSIEFVGQNAQMSKTQTQFKNSYIIDSEKYTPNDNEDSKFAGCIIHSEDLGSSIKQHQNEEDQQIKNIKEESEQDESPKQILVQNYNVQKDSKAVNTSIFEIQSKKSEYQTVQNKNSELVLNITVNQITPQNFVGRDLKNTPVQAPYIQELNPSNFQIQFSVYQQQKNNQSPQIQQIFSQKNLKPFERAGQNQADQRIQRNSIKESILTSHENNLVSEEGNNNLIVDPKLSENKWITITPLNIQPIIKKNKIRQKKQQITINNFAKNQRVYVSQAFRKSKISPNFMMLNTSKFTTEFPNQQIKILQRNFSKFDSFKISEIKKMLDPKIFADQLNKQQFNNNLNTQIFETDNNQIVKISPKVKNNIRYENMPNDQNIIAQIQINKKINGDLKILMDQNSLINQNQSIVSKNDKGNQIEHPTFREKVNYQIDINQDFNNRNKINDSEMNQTMKKKLSSQNSTSQMNFFAPNQISPKSINGKNIVNAFSESINQFKQNEPIIKDSHNQMKNSFHQILQSQSPRIVNQLDHINKIDQQQVFRQFNDISMLRKSSEEFMKNQIGDLRIKQDSKILEYHQTQFPNIQHVSQEQLKELFNKSRNYYKSDPERSNDEDETFQKNYDKQKSNDSQKKTQHTFKDKNEFIERYHNFKKTEGIILKNQNINKESFVRKLKLIEMNKNLQKNKNEINMNRVKKKQFKMAKDEIWGLDSIKHNAQSYMSRQTKNHETYQNNKNQFTNERKFETQMSLPMNQTILNQNIQSKRFRYDDPVRDSLQIQSVSEFTDRKLFSDNLNISRDQGIILKNPQNSVYFPPIKQKLNEHFIKKKQSLKTIDSFNSQLINQPIDSSLGIQKDQIFNKQNSKMQIIQQQFTKSLINNSALDMKMNKLKTRHIRKNTDLQVKKFENHHARKIEEIISKVNEIEMMNESSALLVQDFTIDSKRKQMDSFELTEVKMNNTEMASIFKETMNKYNLDFQKDYNFELSQSDQ